MKRLLLAPLFALLAPGCGGPGLEVFEAGSVTIHAVRAGTWSAFVLEGEAGNVLFETGSTREVDLLFEGLDVAGFSPSALDAVVVSHGHFDHGGGAAALSAETDAPVLIHEADAERLETGDSGSAPVVTWEGHLVAAVLDDTMAPARVDLALQGETSLARFGVDARLVPVPGHTPGSMALLVGEHALVGDLLRTDEGRAITHVFSEDADADRRNMRALVEEGFLRFHPTHGPDVDAAAVQRWLDERQEAPMGEERRRACGDHCS